MASPKLFADIIIRLFVGGTDILLHSKRQQGGYKTDIPVIDGYYVLNHDIKISDIEYDITFEKGDVVYVDCIDDKEDEYGNPQYFLYVYSKDDDVAKLIYTGQEYLKDYFTLPMEIATLESELNEDVAQERAMDRLTGHFVDKISCLADKALILIPILSGLLTAFVFLFGNKLGLIDEKSKIITCTIGIAVIIALYLLIFIYRAIKIAKETNKYRVEIQDKIFNLKLTGDEPNFDTSKGTNTNDYLGIKYTILNDGTVIKEYKDECKDEGEN